MSERTRVVHVHDQIEGAVYIGRAMPRQRLKASPFANPYKIGTPYLWTQGPATRQDVIDGYRIRITENLRGLCRELPALRGKPLACWCRHDGDEPTPDNACHGDILVSLLDSYTDDELRAMGGQR